MASSIPRTTRLESAIVSLRHILVFAVILLDGPPAGAAEVFDSIARIRALPPEQAARRMPAGIDAVVTFYNPVKSNCLVHDGHDGIFVNLTDNPASRPSLTINSAPGGGTTIRVVVPSQPRGSEMTS